MTKKERMKNIILGLQKNVERLKPNSRIQGELMWENLSLGEKEAQYSIVFYFFMLFLIYYNVLSIFKRSCVPMSSSSIGTPYKS
jgi:hypothetical protein